MRLSKFTLFFALYIIVSSYFMLEVWNFWKAFFGEPLLMIFLAALFLITISAVIYKNIQSKNNAQKIILATAIGAVGLILALRQPYVPEKAHVLEFGLLGWLAMRDFTKKNKGLLKCVLLASIFVIIIAVLEEWFQKLLPARFCEMRDIITDSISGTLGISIFALSQTRPAAFIRPL